MMRVRQISTGVVASVSEETADRLGSDWEPVDGAPTDRSETPDTSWKVVELKAYAEQHGIDLGVATKKADILAVIASDDESDDEDDESDEDDE